MISVIIVVKEDRRIERALKRILDIPKPDETEILVVESGDKLGDIREKFSAVKWFNLTSDENVTIPKQRNFGIRNAKGGIIVFTDADCVPERNWLIRLTEPIREDGEAMVAGRAELTSGKNKPCSKFFETGKTYVKECPTLNVAFRRSICEEIGYFDEGFEYGSDVDFTWRSVRKGYRIRYVPSAFVYHDEGDIKREFTRQF